MALLYILVFFLLLRTTDIRKKKCNERIVKLFRKSRRDVSLSQETRSLKRTNLASLSGSCSQFEMLSDFNSLDALEPFNFSSFKSIYIKGRYMYCMFETI